MVRVSSRPSVRSELRGKQTPRVFTPPLRELTPETSLGFEVILFANDVLGITLYPWQEWLLIHALELNEDDGTFRFRKVFVLVGRQNGKSTLLQILTLWRLYLDRATLVLGTAQDRGIARDQWLGAVEIAQSVPELAEEISGEPVISRGFENFALVTGERYEIAASNRRAGRGKAVDLLLMDELREQRTWDAWSAVSKTTNARPKGQVWAVSSAGDASSVVLQHFRVHAHAAVGDPDGLSRDPVTGKSTLPELPDDVDDTDDSLGIFEWSAPLGASVWDRDGWAQSNPSMGYGAINERTLASDARSDPEHVFRTEVMCQFVASRSTGPFPAGAWEATSRVKARRDPDRPAAYGLAMSYDRTWVHVAIAFWTVDGTMHVDMAHSEPGTRWVVDWLKSPERRVPVTDLALQRRGAPISSMWDELVDAGLSPTPWADSNLAGWHGTFYDLIRESVSEERQGVPVEDQLPLPLTHGVHPNLDVAATSAVTKTMSGGVWVLDLKASPGDAAPLQAAIAAVGLLSTNQAPVVSVYESRGLVFID